MIWGDGGWGDDLLLIILIKNEIYTLNQQYLISLLDELIS
jgi:hypothetical protein